MIYHVILQDSQGTQTTHTIDVDCDALSTWSAFAQQQPVKQLLLLHPNQTLYDVTPDGMPDWFTDEQELSNQRAQMGDSKLAIPDDLD
jgi:hypothetical protein